MKYTYHMLLSFFVSVACLSPSSLSQAASQEIQASKAQHDHLRRLKEHYTLGQILCEHANTIPGVRSLDEGRYWMLLHDRDTQMGLLPNIILDEKNEHFINFLRKIGPNINIINTPMLISDSSSMPGIMQEILPVVFAARKHRFDIANTLLGQGADLDRVNPETQIPALQEIFRSLFKDIAKGKISFNSPEQLSTVDTLIKTLAQHEHAPIDAPLTMNRRTYWGTVSQDRSPLGIVLEILDHNAANVLTHTLASYGAHLKENEIDLLSESALVRLAEIAKPTLEKLTKQSLDRDTFSAVQSFISRPRDI